MHVQSHVQVCNSKQMIVRLIVGVKKVTSTEN